MKILSLPVNSKLSYSNIKNSGCESVEFRLDYSRDTGLNSFTHSLLEELKKTAGIKRIIFTHREINEGGKNRLTPEEKIKLLNTLTTHHKAYIDCELDFFLKHKPGFNKDKLIISKHLQAKPGPKQLDELLQSLQSAKALFYKIVLPVETYRDLECYLKLTILADTPLILQGTGRLGKLFRIFRLSKGHQGHYIAYNDKCRTASEQLTLAEMYLYLHINRQETVYYGGIIGSLHAYQSMGLTHYNRLFRKKRLNAVYLPFPVTDLSAFLWWLHRFQDEHKLYGFSVTMPHKRNIASHFEIAAAPNNLVSVKTGCEQQLPYREKSYFYNTDLDAFKKALAELVIKKEDKILIIGYGSTAETALTALRFHENVYISGRNEKKAALLAELYRRSQQSPDKLIKDEYDLIINCTSRGINQESLLALTGPINFRKAIDLPYSEKDTPLIEQCRKYNLPYVSGKKFWRFQAARQEHIFLKNIESNRYDV